METICNIKKVQCTFDDYDKCCDLYEHMDYQAADYVPTEAEFKEIEQHIDIYIKFLIWIDISGYDTEENVKMRKKIRRLLKDRLILVDEIKEETV